MREVTEQELAKLEARYNKDWQQVVDLFLEDPEIIQKEAHLVNTLCRTLHLHGAGLVLSIGMVKLHLAVGQQTGKLHQMGND